MTNRLAFNVFVRSHRTCQFRCQLTSADYVQLSADQQRDLSEGSGIAMASSLIPDNLGFGQEHKKLLRAFIFDVSPKCRRARVQGARLVAFVAKYHSR